MGGKRRDSTRERAREGESHEFIGIIERRSVRQEETKRKNVAMACRIV